MGGHGGLNILPQKRWHVYNQDNRLKVSQDEEKAKAIEDAIQEKAETAEREYRHQLLLQRSQGGTGQLLALAPATAVAAPAGADAAAATVQEAGGAQPLQHVNFWLEDELFLKEQHPEVAAAKKEETRKRGGMVATYTSDPKFDERFQFGYQLADDKPWWASVNHRKQQGTSHPDPALPQLQAAIADSAACTARAGPQPGPPAPLSAGAGCKAAASGLQGVTGDILPTASSSSSDSSNDSSNDSSSDSDSNSSSGSDSSRRRASRKRKRSSKHRSRSPSKRSRDSKRSKDIKRRKHSAHRGKHSKHRRKHSKLRGKTIKGRSTSRDSGKETKRKVLPGALSVEQLRAERLEREHKERARAQLVLIGADPNEKEPRGYHGSFGNAALLKKKAHR